MRGDLVVRFTVRPDGGVAGMRTIENTLGTDDVLSCITHDLLSWRFPEAPNGMPTTVTYPYTLR